MLLNLKLLFFPYNKYYFNFLYLKSFCKVFENNMNKTMVLLKANNVLIMLVTLRIIKAALEIIKTDVKQVGSKEVNVKETGWHI